jgi:nucleoside-diphosphate-sugar epimerase
MFHHSEGHTMNIIPASQTVLILGTNGRLGSAAVNAFAAAGWQILAQARRAPAILPAGARHIAIDLADVGGLANAAANATVVVYAVNPPYTKWAIDMLPLARHAMDIAQRIGAVFMLPGNIYNFGEDMPPLLRENTVQQPTTHKGRLRHELEHELQTRAKQGLRSVVIRAGDFFGAEAGAKAGTWFDLAIVKSIKNGKLVYPGRLDRAHAWAFLPDLARTFVAVASQKNLPVFTALHFPGDTVTGAELLLAIENAAKSIGYAPHKKFKYGKLPWHVIRIGGWLIPMWREVAEMSYLWDVPHALDGAALENLIGAIPKTELNMALQATLGSMG